MPRKKPVYGTKKGCRGNNDRPDQSRIQKKIVQNRYSMERDDDVSTSAKKLKLSEDSYDIDMNASFSYRFIDFITVFTALSQLVVCKTCHSSVTFAESSCRGLGYKIKVCCEKCDSNEILASPLINNRAYDINRRIVFAMRLLGIGLNGIKKFCAFMDLPRPIFHSFYDEVVRNISAATKIVCEMSMKKAAAQEKEMSMKEGQLDGLSVSGDGTWRKRGFSSLYGLVTLIGWQTGKVIDVLVKSKYCKACEFWEKRKDTAEYEEWAGTHAQECQCNHEGSAGKMEVDAVVEMFSRSVTLYGVKYSNYIGDGDSKTFKGIIDVQPYEDLVVKKKECIDHVQKRMGSRLRALRKSTKGLSGKGKLTGKLIDELTLYFGLAIRRHHDSEENMRNAIFATLYHKISTDEEPQHQFCPDGENSWCSWQKAKAANTLDQYEHKTPLNIVVFNAIKPIYEELSRKDLLTRCIGGYTQNRNESFNSVVWSIAPKTISSGANVLNMATNIAVCAYNDGLFSIMAMMQILGLKIGSNCYSFCAEADAQRISAAESSMSEAGKEARKTIQAIRKEAEETDEVLEGVLYGAGIAD